MQKTIELKKKFQDEQEGKYGKYTKLALISVLNERYTTIKKKEVEALSQAVPTDLITLEFENTEKPQQFKILRVIGIAKNTRPPPFKAPQNHMAFKEKESLPSLPEPLTDSMIEAMIDASKQHIASVLHVRPESIESDNGLLSRVFEAKVTQHRQRFQLEILKYEEAAKQLSFRRWHPEAK